MNSNDIRFPNNFKPSEFDKFKSITELTLDMYNQRFYTWTSDDDLFITHVSARVQEFFYLVGDDKSEESISWLQRCFKKNLGLNIYKAYGAWTEGYIDKYSQRKKAFLYFEHGTCYDELCVYDRREFELNRKCDGQKAVKSSIIVDEDDDLPF